MTHLGLWQHVKTGVRDGDAVTLRRLPVTTSRSGRFVYEYEVIYLSTGRTVWKGMSRKYGFMYFNVETSR